MASSFYQTTGDTVVPAPRTSAASISITTNTTLTGSGFRDLKAGDWIVDDTNSEVRRIKKVVSDTELQLYKPFSFETTTSEVVDKDVANAVYMEIIAVGDITIDGVSRADESVTSFGNANASGDFRKTIIPRFVTGTAVVNIEYVDNNFVG